MKKGLFIIILVISFCTFAYSFDASLLIEEKEKVDLEETPQKDPEKERSLKIIECYLNRLENTIEVEYSGIGTPIVYILDASDNILSYNPANGISGSIIINLPQAEGIYTVLIQSPVYCGEGIFYIY